MGAARVLRAVLGRMISDFVHTTQEQRVVFGVGSLSRLGAELDALGLQRSLILTTPEQASTAHELAATLSPRACGVYDRAAMHVPVATVEEAHSLAVSRSADCCIAIGGGSTTGLAKAIALQLDMPIVAVPTTYAGSEMTTIYGITGNGSKKTGRDKRVLPSTVIYDPALTVGMSATQSAASGFNAIAHCVEALYAPDRNPLVALLAEEGVRVLAAALPVISQNPLDLNARSEALLGAWLAGTSLSAAGMSLHHKLCHVLGGTYDLPHAQMHAALLPHATRYNRDAAPEAMQQIARALGRSNAPNGLYELGRRLGLEMSLAKIGMPENGLACAAQLATGSPYPNPAPIEYRLVLALLRNAHNGVAPAA